MTQLMRAVKLDEVIEVVPGADEVVTAKVNAVNQLYLMMCSTRARLRRRNEPEA